MHPHTTLLSRVVVLLALLATSACSRAESRVLFDKPSEFNHVIVREDDRGVRYLLFEEDGATQTAVDTRDPQRLVIAYTRTAMTGLAIVPKPNRILMVGLGGGAMPMFLRRNFPDATIDIAELDPVVAEAAKRFFGFREDPKMTIHIGDGRKFIETSPAHYDLIFLDAFGPDSIPYALATREFLLAVRNHLTDEGLVVANVWASSSNPLYFSMVRTYLDVFPELHIVRAPLSSNRIFLALPRKLNLTKRQFMQKAEQIQPKLKPQLELAEMLENGYLDKIDLVPDAKVLLDADAPRQQ